MKKFLCAFIFIIGFISGAYAACPTNYPNIDADQTDNMYCYLTTTAGKYVATPGAAETQCPVGAICSGGAKIYSTRYQPVEYVETTGTQYIDTGIIGETGVDMEIDAMRTDYAEWYNVDFPIIGCVYTDIGVFSRFYINYGYSGNTTYRRTILASLGGFAANRSFNPQQNTYYKAKMISNTGELYINDIKQNLNFSLDYPMLDFHKNLNIYIGRINASGEPYSIVGKARIRSSKIWDNDVLVRDYIPVYDLITKKYGMYDMVSDTFSPSLSSDGFLGPYVSTGIEYCPELVNAHYTTSGTCDYACNDGYNLTHDNKCMPLCNIPGIRYLNTSTGIKIPLYTQKQTTPALVIQYDNQLCYGNLILGEQPNSLIIQVNNEKYHAVN